MSLNGRIGRLEREAPPDVCPHRPLLIREGEPGQPTGPIPPCPLCGQLPMVVRIVTADAPPPWEVGA